MSLTWTQKLSVWSA